MKTLRCFFHRLRSLAKPGQHEERLRAEIEEHLALQTEENLRAGLSPAEARRRAVLQFGGVEGIKESYRDQRGLPFFEMFFQDIRHTLRRLRMAPAFTVTTILTLALGIGATTSIFTLAHAVLLKSLPVAKPDELYRVGKEARCCFWGMWSQKDEFSLISYDLYTYFRDHTKGFAELAAFSASEDMLGVRRIGFAESAQGYDGEYVSGNYFSMFGIQPYAGRAIAPADDRLGAAPVVMMTYRLWEEKYALDPSVIGGVFNFNEKPFTVIGITPPGFYGDQLRDSPPDFFLPIHTADASDVATPNLYWFDVIGRIRPGAHPVPVETEMRNELRQWLRGHWSEMSLNDRALFPQQTLYLRPGGSGITSMRDQYERWLRILLIASGFVLLIVCATVANLMLVRGIERRRQTSLCIALGAQARRVVRQALTESLLLSLLGGAAGLALAFAGTRLILGVAFPAKTGLAVVPITASPSLPVLLFVCAVSLLTGIAFGFGPAWMATRIDPIEALRGAGRATARMGSTSRRALVVIQTALSLALLAASGLLTATLHRLESQDFGFAQERRLVMTANPREAGYGPDQLTQLYRRIHDSLITIPGVSDVALSIYSPMADNFWGASIRMPGRAPAGPGDDRDAAGLNRATTGYFRIIGTPIIQGRDITEQDTANSQRVAVINEAFARRFFGNEDPIGRFFGQIPLSDSQYKVVGVARDARFSVFDMDKPVAPFFVLPEAQLDYFRPSGGKQVEAQEGSHFLRDIVIELRPGAGPSLAQTNARIRQTMASVDPNLPVLAIRSLKEQVSGQFIQQRLIARLTSLFGILSLVLAAIGLYGVIAYNVSSRTGEIGARMAIGAAKGDIIALVLRGAVALILIGLVIGLPLAFAAGRFLGSQLYGMSPYDPAVISTAVAVLALSALIASFVPAFRASLISPLEALRAE
jgi:predicted permease